MKKLSPLHQSAILFPNSVFVEDETCQITYKQASDKVLSLVIQLQKAGLKPGDLFTVSSENNIEMILVYWACIDLGVVFCPISYRFPESQINDLMDEYNIKHYWALAPKQGIAKDKYIELNFDLSFDTFDENAFFKEVDFKTPSNLIFTSGSSGKPKAAIHNLYNHIYSAKGAEKMIPLSVNNKWLLSLPLFHIGGLAIVHRCTLAGASVVIKNNNIPLAEQITNDDITHVSLVATQLLRLINENPESLLNLKALLLGGGAISQTLINKIKPLNVPTYTSYGMTEMSSQITTGLALGDGSSGKLLADRELKIRNNVIWVKGKVLFQGYLQHNGTVIKETDSEDWFCTKDCGYWDDNGNLHITGRSDNMFVCGGENIHPEEIENALKLHSYVEEAVVFPMQDDEFGLLPAAIVKLKTKDDFCFDVIENFLLTKIARFKRPRCYYLWPENSEQSSLKISRKQIVNEITNCNE